MYVTAVNVGSVPVQVDAEGRSIAPGDWGSADPDDTVATVGFQAGDLHDVDVPDDGTPLAVEARDRTAWINDRVSQVSSFSDEELAEAAAAAGVSDVENLPRAQLVNAVAVRVGYALPPQEPAPAEIAPGDTATAGDAAPVEQASPADKPDDKPKARPRAHPQERK